MNTNVECIATGTMQGCAFDENLDYDLRDSEDSYRSDSVCTWKW